MDDTGDNSDPSPEDRKKGERSGFQPDAEERHRTPTGEEFTEFLSQLAYAKLVYDAAGQGMDKSADTDEGGAFAWPPTEHDGGRKGVAIACRAVARLLYLCNVSPDYAVPFQHTQFALMDFEQGITAHLLSKDPNSQKRGRSKLHLWQTTFAAVCLEVLRELGDRRDDAASQIARSVNKWSGFGIVEVNAQTIVNWRNELRRETKNTWEIQQFHMLKSRMLSDPDPRARVEEFLKKGPQ